MSNKIFEAYKQILAEVQTITQPAVQAKTWSIKVNYTTKSNAQPQVYTANVTLPADATTISVEKPQ